MKLIFSYLFGGISYLRYQIETRCRWVWEVLFMILTFLVFLVSFLIQFGVVALPTSLLISEQNQAGFFLTVFQIQATVSTLSIIVISLIAGITRDQYYGIQTTNYILNLRPRILKHKFIVIFDLYIIIANLVFCSLKLYNLCSACLIISVLLSVRMFSEIYNVFSQTRGTLKYQIMEYILSEAVKKKLERVKQQNIEVALRDV